MKETLIESSRVITILDVINENLTLREDILAEVEKRLAKGQHIKEYTELIRFARTFRAIDDIELIVEEIHPEIDRDRGLEIQLALGKKAEERVGNIIRRFDYVADVTKAPDELDHEGVDLLVDFKRGIPLEQTGIQVKISQRGIQDFIKKHDLDYLVSMFNLIIVNAHPNKQDSDIQIQLGKIFNKRMRRANALTNSL